MTSLINFKIKYKNNTQNSVHFLFSDVSTLLVPRSLMNIVLQNFFPY